MSATMHQDDLCHFEEFRCLIALAEARMDRRRSNSSVRSSEGAAARASSVPRTPNLRRRRFRRWTFSIIKRDLDQCGDSIENIADFISH